MNALVNEALAITPATDVAAQRCCVSMELPARRCAAQSYRPAMAPPWISTLPRMASPLTRPSKDIFTSSPRIAVVTVKRRWSPVSVVLLIKTASPSALTVPRTS